MGGRGAAVPGTDGGGQVPSCQLGDSPEVQSVPLHVQMNFKTSFFLKKEEQALSEVWTTLTSVGPVTAGNHKESG